VLSDELVRNKPGRAQPAVDFRLKRRSDIPFDKSDLDLDTKHVWEAADGSFEDVEVRTLDIDFDKIGPPVRVP
jgi:hypothetical protein